MLYYYSGDNMIESKKQVFIIVGIFTLILALTSVKYSFFNYTRTGLANTLRVGNIYFNTTEGTALNITNAFPMTSTEAGNANLDLVTVGIVGNTTYTDGEEYLITLTGLNNTINVKEIPLNYIATYEAATGGTIGTSSNDYFNARNSKYANIYTLNSTGEVSEGKQVLIGYIDNEGAGINGTLTIKAYIDADRIAISDTYNTPPATPNDNMGTTSSWVNGRTVFTTTEWNSLSSNPISFKIKAESNEGMWTYPIIPSCQGCKFYYAESGNIYTTWTSYSETPTVITTGLSNNYLDIIASSGKPYFLGLKLNNSNQVTNISVCGIKSSIPFCLEVDQNGSYYEENKELLQSSNLWNNTCDIDIIDQGTQNEYEETYCSTDIFNASVSIDGAMIRDGNGGMCSIHSDGFAVCYGEDPN